MNRHAFTALCLTTPLLALAAPSPEQRARATLDALREVSGVPGMAAAVWQHGRLRWHGESGWADVAQRLPVRAETRFRLASVSKLFAAVAAAQLRADGRLSPDRPVGDLLPGLDPTLAVLTPAQLAAHLSGLPHYEARDEGRGERHYDTARASLEHLANRQLRAAPGERYLYSSWGYTLLAAAAEAAAERPYPALLTARVAPGLAIGPDLTGKSPTMTQAYTFGSQGAEVGPPHDYSYSWGGAALAGTASALAEWGGQVLQGPIVDAATRDWMWTPVRDTGGRTVGERTYKMGFGWRLDQDAQGQRLVHHAGATLGARSALLVWPQAGTSVSLLSNAMWTSSIERSAELLSAPFRAPVAGLPAAACPVAAKRFEGEVDGQAISGAADFRRDADGLCLGRLSLPAALAAVVNPGPQPASERMQVVGLQGELSRAALVTGIGLADWRAQDDGSVRIEGVAGRRIVLRLVQESGAPVR
jgi:CubicO group peptidase (beta-lactamase class C family)